MYITAVSLRNSLEQNRIEKIQASELDVRLAVEMVKVIESIGLEKRQKTQS